MPTREVEPSSSYQIQKHLFGLGAEVTDRAENRERRNQIDSANAGRTRSHFRPCFAPERPQVTR